MYDFAIVALLALATLKLVDFLTDSVPQLRNMRTLLTFVVAVGATVLIDETSLDLLEGCTIDFVDDLVGQSFRITNPNATASCGCGTSFAL